MTLGSSLPARPAWLLSALLLSAAASAVQAATVRVQGNGTSDIIATGFDEFGRMISDRRTEHPGDTGLVPWSGHSVSLFQDISVNAPSAHSELHLSGHADVGTLGIDGKVKSNISIPRGHSGQGSGGIHAEWRALMTVYGDPGLPVGTPVEFQATLVVHGDGSITKAHNYLLASFAFAGLAPTQTMRCTDFNSACSFSEAITLRGHVGTTYSLSGQLDLGVSSSVAVHQAIYDSSAQVSAGNTSQIYVDVLTPGASYLLDTGTVFPTTPVPEPASLWLMLAGALWLGLHRSRRARGLGTESASSARRRIQG